MVYKIRSASVVRTPSSILTFASIAPSLRYEDAFFVRLPLFQPLTESRAPRNKRKIPLPLRFFEKEPQKLIDIPLRRRRLFQAPLLLHLPACPILSILSSPAMTHSGEHPIDTPPRAPSPVHRFGTLAVHAGSPHDPVTGAVIESVRSLRLYVRKFRANRPQISLSTTFAQTAVGKPVGEYEYTRSSNPNRSDSRYLVDNRICS